MASLVIYVSLIYAIASCGLLLGAFFRLREQPNRYPVIGIWMIGLHAVYKLIWLTLAGGNQYEAPIPLGLAYPVLLYLFAHANYLPGRTISAKRINLLFSPVVVHLVLLTVASLQPVESGWIMAYSTIYYVCCMLSLLVFATLTARLYSGYKGTSAPTDILIRQLAMLCYGLVVLAYIILYQATVAEREIGFEVRPVVYLFMIIGCALIVRYLLAQRTSLLPGNVNVKPQESADKHKPDAMPASLANGTALVEIVERELHESELFLNPAISLDMLAQQTSIPRHQLTQIFSGHYGKSFYQFIAGMRIEYAISRIFDIEDTITLDSLSYACGFNSKTSFNRYFKAYTGMTPSEYRSVHRSVCDQAVSVSR